MRPIGDKKYEMGEFSGKICCIEQIKHENLQSVEKFENFRRFENQFFGTMYDQYFEKAENEKRMRFTKFAMFESTATRS